MNLTASFAPIAQTPRFPSSRNALPSSPPRSDIGLTPRVALPMAADHVRVSQFQRFVDFPTRNTGSITAILVKANSAFVYLFIPNRPVVNPTSLQDVNSRLRKSCQEGDPMLIYPIPVEVTQA